MADVAVHSDFLIHWTGKDLDEEADPDWYGQQNSQLKGKDQLADRYLGRLRDVLDYGLWLTAEPEQQVDGGGISFTIPSTPKVCFTELKLSESRKHARQYGRLGIGVKRPFLVSRSGRPLSYVCFDFSRHRDPLFAACLRELSDRPLLNFFKPMNSGEGLNYDWYSESEWRILFEASMLEAGLLVDPRNEENVKEHSYYQSLSEAQQDRLRYLAPVDGWLAMLIYPSTSVKNAAREDSRVRAALSRIKGDPSDHGNRVEGGNWPIELDLDACRNF